MVQGSEAIDLRCDQNSSRLFARLLSDGKPAISNNLFEFKCRDCARRFNKDAVFHRFNIAGELVETEML